MTSPAARSRTLYERLQMAVLPPLLGVARRLPSGPAIGLIVAAGAAQTLLDPRRLKRALVWASAYRSGFGPRAALLVRLIGNRGRFLAWNFGRPRERRAAEVGRVAVEHRDRLDAAAATGGVLLVSFHLGPGRLSRVFTALGYPVVVGTGGVRFGWRHGPPQPEPERIFVAWQDAPSRAVGLYRLADALRRGSLVILPADSGDDSRVEFVVPLPGRSLAIRSGWFTLRRVTGATTMPVLQHWHGGRRIVRVYPPFPAVDPDVHLDREACRSHLSPILSEYAAAYPEQCISLAFGPDAGAPGA
jgi:hypothetical protein